jgi:hypothetical protein
MEHRLISTPAREFLPIASRFRVTGRLICALKFLPQHLVSSAFRPFYSNLEIPSDD